MAWGHFDERELDLDGGRPLRVCLWPPGLSCSGECWPRRQKVISCRSATGVIHHQCQWLAAAYLSGIDWNRCCGQSMGAFHSPWTFTFWCSILIGRAHSGTVGLYLLCVMKRSGKRVMNTLVLAACWASHGCAWHMCENPVVFPLHCQEPTDLA